MTPLPPGDVTGMCYQLCSAVRRCWHWHDDYRPPWWPTQHTHSCQPIGTVASQHACRVRGTGTEPL